MLTKCKDIRRLDPEKSVIMLCVRGVFRIFFRGLKGDQYILTFFPTVLLRGRNKNNSRGVWGNTSRPILFENVVSWNFFENVVSVIGHFVLFVQFLRKNFF